eukprot:m.169070 g.169070  ORF g.169070 m.169070 type:complete len:82 (-) comp25101_c0_seq1:1639-1884(-)
MGDLSPSSETSPKPTKDASSSVQVTPPAVFGLKKGKGLTSRTASRVLAIDDVNNDLVFFRKTNLFGILSRRTLLTNATAFL